MREFPRRYRAVCWMEGFLPAYRGRCPSEFAKALRTEIAAERREELRRAGFELEEDDENVPARETNRTEVPYVA